jgi:hypothetical protein
MNEITMNQAMELMDTICETIVFAIERTLILTGGELPTTECLTPEIEEKTRECFCKIGNILNIEEVLEEKE